MPHANGLVKTILFILLIENKGANIALIENGTRWNFQKSNLLHNLLK